jgi:hypothetical protein
MRCEPLNAVLPEVTGRVGSNGLIPKLAEEDGTRGPSWSCPKRQPEREAALRPAES